MKTEPVQTKPALKAGEPLPSRLSEDLRDLLRHANGRDLSVRELEQALKGRGVAMLILLLALPFIVPNIPGLSTPFGLAIMLAGFRIAMGQKPWTPAFVLDRRVQFHTLEKFVRKGASLAVRMEKMIKPRMHFLQRWPGMMNLIGVAIALSGLVLALPLPIPFSNTLPALAVILLTAGMMERDGLFVLSGHILSLASLVYVAAWLFLFEEARQKTFQWFAEAWHFFFRS